MKKYTFHFVRYSILLLPLLLLIFVVTHIHNSTKQNDTVASNHIPIQVQHPDMLSSSSLQGIIKIKRDTLIHELLPSLPTELNIN